MIKKSIAKWIEYGGKSEDSGRKFDLESLSTRAFNHFHDPLEEWTEAGLGAVANILYIGRYWRSPVSFILWGLEPGRQDFEGNDTGDWSWGRARESFFSYLDGRDFKGEEVAETDAERQKCLAECFRSLGQLMHLLQDSSVPLHTRNDVHFPINNYETYTKRNRESLDYTPDRSGDIPDSVLWNDPRPDPNFGHLAPISGLFDRNMYNGDSMPAADARIGLAEYSNANFFTEDTMKSYPHPCFNDTNYDENVWRDPEAFDEQQDGQIDEMIYFRKIKGDQVKYFMAASCWYYELFMWNAQEIKYATHLDDRCFENYAKKLVPRAVGYSAALLDYFFRGEMEVNAVPVIFEEAIHSFVIDVKNITQSRETMSNGRFSLSVRYTPFGGNSDGGDDIFVRANDVQSGDLQYGQEMELQFDLREPVPKALIHSVKCMLTFIGTLGNEEYAVIGKYLILRSIKKETAFPGTNKLYGNGLP